MDNITIHPTYFASVSHYVAIIQSKQVTFEGCDNFQKQTLRNRMYIAGPNGIQMLNIAIKANRELKTPYKDIEIDNSYHWQTQHYKSLVTAYQNSPFFEYFIDDLMVLFEREYRFLYDLNLDTFNLVNQCLGISRTVITTDSYEKDLKSDQNDLRFLVQNKKDKSKFTPYTQVFDQKNGFLNNLSILDLLFNEGRYGIDYLKQQHI